MMSCLMLNNLTKHHLCSMFIPCLIVFLLSSLLMGCRTTNTDSGVLRGDRISLHFPLQNGVSEAIVVGPDRVAARAFDPVTWRTKINNVVVEEPLWTDLEILRTNWCQQPPTFASHTPDAAAYRVVFECHAFSGLPNPIYYVQPANLPEPLHRLIELIPSTAERVLPQ